MWVWIRLIHIWFKLLVLIRNILRMSEFIDILRNFIIIYWILRNLLILSLFLNLMALRTEILKLLILLLLIWWIWLLNSEIIFFLLGRLQSFEHLLIFVFPINSSAEPLIFACQQNYSETTPHKSFLLIIIIIILF